MKYILIFIFLASGLQATYAQLKEKQEPLDYWKITDRQSILLDLTKRADILPHKDNIEMSGKNVSAILFYAIDKDGNLTLNRDVIFPQLRIYNKTNEPDWKKYRAYFRKMASDNLLPSIIYNEKRVMPGKVDSVEINGKLRFYHSPVEGLKITRTLFPSMDDRYIVEEWEIENRNATSIVLKISNFEHSVSETGFKGKYTFTSYSSAIENKPLVTGERYSFPVYFGAILNDEKKEQFDSKKAQVGRDKFLSEVKERLVLKTPNEQLNLLFYFSKIRASESIFNSSMGLVHSPGGGNYYTGIWANDQIEYQGPFTPYLGYENGERAAYNAYKYFMKNMPKDDRPIAYAFEMDGNFAMDHLERGDAAMIAYGTSHYALATGDSKIAEELWPMIEWSLEFCHGKRNTQGAIESESDEMEGRIETGSANLSTSSLYYGGLKYAMRLAKALGKTDLIPIYKARFMEMESVIENYFGANIEGLDTYKYYKENSHLRHWICLPLCMGIEKRKEGTMKALFDKLWTENGILVELNTEKETQTLFWDRATLYALRGAIRTGGKDTSGKDIGVEKLKQYSRKRLLGDHVPYVVEAYPENNMKHLSAESALYCRIFTEGILGIEIHGFDKFTLNPSLPDAWNYLHLNNLALFGKSIDIHLEREGDEIRVKAKQEGRLILNDLVKDGFVTLQL